MRMVFWYVINNRYSYFSLPMVFEQTFLQGNLKPELIGESVLRKKNQFEEMGFLDYMDFSLEAHVFLETYGITKSSVEIICESNHKEVDKNDGQPF